MKNKLLITTAIAAVFGISGVHAESLNIAQGDVQNISDYSVYDTINISGTLNLSNDLVAEKIGDAIIIEGGNIVISKDGGSIAAIKDEENFIENYNPEEKRNILINNANITLGNTSDVIGAAGDLSLTGTTLTAKDLQQDEVESELGNLFALGNINIENSKLDMEGLLIEAGYVSDDEKQYGDGTITISNSEVKADIWNESQSGGIIFDNSKVSSKDIWSINGDISIQNKSEILVTATGDNGIQSDGKLSISDSTVTVLPDESDHELTDQYGDYICFGGHTSFDMTNSTLNLSGKVDLGVGDKGAHIVSSTINIMPGSYVSTFEDDKNINLDHSTLNLAGTLVSHLNGNGTINFQNSDAQIEGNVSLDKGGVMNLGSNQVKIAGDVLFNAGSSLKIDVNDAGNGMLSATSIKAVSDSELVLNISKKMYQDETTTITLFEGDVENNFTNNINNKRYEVALNDDGKSYTLTYTATASDVVEDAGGTANNAGTAEAWDGFVSLGENDTIAAVIANKLNDLSQNNPQKYVEALTAVAPEVAPMVQQTQSETANQIFGAVGTRLSGSSVSGGAQGMSSGDSVFERAAVWVQGLFNKSKLDDTAKAKGFDSDTTGVAFGLEKFVSEDVKAGIGYAYSNTDIDGFMRDTDVDTHTAILYGEYKPSNWYVNTIATYGWSDYKEKKNVSGVRVKADYDVETFGLQAMTGYDLKLDGFGLTPEAGVRYVHIKQDGYKDSADQRVSGNDSDIVTGVVGAKLSKNFSLSNGMMIKPEARIAATYDLKNDKVHSIVTLANDSAYSVSGKALDRFGMEFGAGVSAQVNDNVELTLAYEGKFRKDYQDHTGLINFKYKF